MAYEHLYDGVLSHSLAWTGLAFMTGAATWRAAVQREAGVLPFETFFFVGGAVAAAAGVVAGVRHTTLDVAETLTVAHVWAVLTLTHFGHAMLLHAAFLLAMVATWAALRRRTGVGQRPALWLPAAGAIVFQCGLGHAGAEGFSWPILLFAVHAAAMVLWLGGLFVWVAQLSTGYAAAMVGPLQAFSRLAGVAMAIGLPSGAAIALYQLPGLADAWSLYGAVLLGKLVLVAAILVIAGGHRWRRLPSLVRDPYDLGAWTCFESRVFGEAVLAVAVVMVAAGLSQLSPG